LLLLTIVAGWYLHVGTRERILDYKVAELSHQLNLRENLLIRDIEEARLKVRFLYSTPPVQGIVRATANNGIDPYDGTQLTQWYVRLETIFEAYLENNPNITQARFIGVADQGRELVRVARSLGNIKVTGRGQLQRKGERDYFRRISELAFEETYVSGINLNREHGRVVIPYQPTYRAGIPVYDAQQQLFGMLVLNFDARRILGELQSDLPDTVDILLLNASDGFIVHPDPDYAFQQELGGVADWGNYYRQLDDPFPKLEHLLEQRTGLEYYAMESLVSIPNSGGNQFMRLVLKTPVALVEDELFYQSTQTLVVAGGALVLVIVFLVIYQSNVTKNLRLSEAQAQFEAIIEGSSDAIVGMDTMGVVTSWNTSAQDILGYSSRQALGQRLDHLIAVEGQQEEIDPVIKQIAMGKYHEPLRLTLAKRNQSQLHVSMSFSPIMLDSHRVVGVATIIRDITEQVEAEEEIQKMNASLEYQVQERTRELEAARNEALSASLTKSSFIANVSHEMRTPLNGIIGMHNMLRKSNTAEQHNRYLAMAEASAEALASLINDVLDLSKIEAGKLEIENVNYDLIEVVSHVVTSLSIKAFEKNIELILDVAGIEQATLVGDASRLRQILINLVGNAIKFTTTGWVKLALQTQQLTDGQVEVGIQVQDTGVGISAEKQAWIFEAFAQEDSSVTRRFGGTGLGLSITRQLCHLLDGDIQCDSEQGEGSTFRCTLRQGISQEPGLDVSLDLSAKQFLVVDPCLEVAAGIARQLRCWQAGEVDCLTGPDIHKLPALVTQKAFDLVLVDETLVDAAVPEGMEGMTGMDAQRLVLLVHFMGRDQPSRHGQSFLNLQKPVTPLALARLLHQAGVVPASAQAQVADRIDAAIVPQALDLSNLNILVVDDNRINQQVAVGMLEDYGATLITADNGQEALARMAETTFHLVLMDCQMPVMDGYTATREIRKGSAGERSKSIPIVAMTASAMAGDRERCMSAGMDDYITKPLEPEELETRLVYWSHQIRNNKPVVSGGATATGVAAQSATADLGDYPVWDSGALAKRVKYKQHRMLEMISLFKEVSAEKIDQLSAAIEQEQFARVDAIAHAIKGSAGNLGATRLQMLCQHIETAARAQASRQLQMSKDQLHDEYNLLLVQLQQKGPDRQDAIN